jgi:hypothetical protein
VKLSQSPHLGRLGRAMAVAAAVLLASTACTYTNPQETTRITPATNGINTTVGPAKLEDFLIVSRGAAWPGRVLGAITNTTGRDITVTLNEDPGTSAIIRVKAGGQRLLATEESPVTLARSGADPGAMVRVRISVDGASREVQIPVLDDTIKEYAQYLPVLPTPSPSGASSFPTSTS